MPRKGKDTRTSRHNPNTPDIPGPPAQTLTLRGQHSFVKPLASEPNPAPPPVSLDCRGKIGQTVYQLTRGWINHYEHAKELMLQRRRHVMPFDPRTNLQLLCRCRFAAAVAGWHLLTTEDKRGYNRRGNARFNRIEGLNVWIREFIKEHELDEYQLEAILKTTQSTIPFPPPDLLLRTFAGPKPQQPPGPPEDTMLVTQDIGPTAQQNNIAPGGEYVNNIAITATKAGHMLLIAKVSFASLAANETVQISIDRNGAPVTGGSAKHFTATAQQYRTLNAQAGITDAAINDVFKILALSSSGTADIPINLANLITVTP